MACFECSFDSGWIVNILLIVIRLWDICTKLRSFVHIWKEIFVQAVTCRVTELSIFSHSDCY
jgi:hypothetical protein